MTHARLLPAVLALFLAACAPVEHQDPRKAMEASQHLVRDRLASPGTVQFGGEADTTVEEISHNRFRVRGMVDYAGLDKATMRVRYTCVVRYRGPQNWQLEEIEFQ